MRRVLAFGLIALIGLLLFVGRSEAQPPPRLWMVHNVLYPNGTAVPSADLTFEAWLIKVSGGQTAEILTETTSGCGVGDTDPEIWVEASMFGEWDQPSTWYAVGDTIYCTIYAANDPQGGGTLSRTIWDTFDDLAPGTSWEYYPEDNVTVPIELVSFAADVSGTWEFTMQSPRGEDMTSDITIEQDGEKIKVTMQGFRGDEMEGEGTVKENKIEWIVNISTQRGDFSITYKGTVEGDTMSGTAEMGDFGSMEWTAKKK